MTTTPVSVEDAVKTAKEAVEKLGGSGKKHEEQEGNSEEKQDKENSTFDPDYRRGEFEPDFLKLYMQDPFLGGVSLEVTKIIDNKVPTAYMGVRPNGRSHEIVLGVNSKFFRKLAEDHRQGVLKHELYHMIFQHIFTRSIGEKSYQVLWNWATDMAINSIIGEKNLPKSALLPGRPPINEKGEPIEGPYGEFIAKAKPLQASDYYFEELRKIQDEQGDDDSQMAIGSGIDTMDDHGGWQDLPAEVQEQIKDKVRDMVEKSVKRADQDNSWGSVPAEIQEAIRRLISREIDWRSIIKNFIGRTRTLERYSTIKRINKKAPYIHPGVRRPLRAEFICFIDQSGSMSDEDIAMLFGELESFARETKLDVYHFDTEVDLDSHTVWQKGKEFPKAHRTRCGGTDFQCVADFCNDAKNKGSWSGVVILTDGYAPTMGGIVGAKVLWVITETGTTEAIRAGDYWCQMKAQKKFQTF